MLAGNESRGDPQGHVNEYLNRPSFFLSGLDLRVFSLFGDRIAAAILNVVSSDEETSYDKLRKILVAVRSSLEFPGDIRYADDRIPRFTMLLLNLLMERTELSEQRDSIRQTIDFVRDHAEPTSG
jgi:hypothetical protein